MPQSNQFFVLINHNWLSRNQLFLFHRQHGSIPFLGDVVDLLLSSLTAVELAHVVELLKAFLDLVNILTIDLGQILLWEVDYYFVFISTVDWLLDVVDVIHHCLAKRDHVSRARKLVNIVMRRNDALPSLNFFSIDKLADKVFEKRVVEAQLESLEGFKKFHTFEVLLVFLTNINFHLFAHVFIIFYGIKVFR